jgi:DNA-binding transcriptional regulator YbjK
MTKSVAALHAAVGTPERILTAALVIAEREGLDAVSHRAVAKEAAVAVGLIRYHFHSIGELLDAVLAQAVASLALASARPIAMPEGDARDAAALSLTLDLVVLLSQDRNVTIMWLEILLRSGQTLRYQCAAAAWRAHRQRAIEAIVDAANLQLSADAMRGLGDYMLGETIRQVPLPLSTARILEMQRRIERFLDVLKRNEQEGLFLQLLADAR